jgi:hypothetical protein
MHCKTTHLFVNSYIHARPHTHTHYSLHDELTLSVDIENELLRKLHSKYSWLPADTATLVGDGCCAILLCDCNAIELRRAALSSAALSSAALSSAALSSAVLLLCANAVVR